MRVHIVGSGLIGTSIGMALAVAGDLVSFSDLSDSRAELAKGLTQNVDLATGERCDLLIAAVPSGSVPEVIIDAFRKDLASNFTDTASIKAKCVDDIESFAPDLARRYCGSHPIAGREVSGPESAQADLFNGRPWVITPTGATELAAITAVRHVLRTAGAVEIEMTPPDHDQAVALISHAPQVVASLMAGELTRHATKAAELSGQGLRDVTRIAASDSRLWREILSANRSALLPILASLQQRLGEVITGLSAPEGDAGILDFLEDGRRGRDLIPGKHGTKRAYVILSVLIADAPGQLKSLFNDAGDANINIEDVTMEHSPGHPTGLVQISVAPEQASALEQYLRGRGWHLYAPSNDASLR